jgi:hypothetical protein
VIGLIDVETSPVRATEAHLHCVKLAQIRKHEHQLRHSAAVKSTDDKAAATARRWFHMIHALRYRGQNAIASAGSAIDAS